ncbi:hypothetical protein LI177_02935 [bacterium 210820-DFI.6.37]|nr:hypothetical protein [bacterium 210820-DFI.6.37]
MNWGELKNEVKDLGFEEMEALVEYKDILVSATNRAMYIINSTVLPMTSRYDFMQDGSEPGIKKYDMIELTKEGGSRKFLSFADTPVKIHNETYETFNDFDIEEGHIVVMDGSCVGNFSVFYKRIPSRVSENTTDDTELDVDARIEPALPLLVAHYVWLDDDERKATQYYNEYDALKTDILTETTLIRAKIRGGF